MVVTLVQQYNNVGEKPTVILYTNYINRHAGTPNKTKIGYTTLDYSSICCIGSSLGSDGCQKRKYSSFKKELVLRRVLCRESCCTHTSTMDPIQYVSTTTVECYYFKSLLDTGCTSPPKCHFRTETRRYRIRKPNTFSTTTTTY